MTRNTHSRSTDPATTIGDRVRASIPSHLSQRRLAPEVGMTHDALSRAINGQRHFSALEVAELANRLDVDTHWLITGHEDPFKIRVAARHPWDQSSPGSEEGDAKIIARVAEAYRAAYAEGGVVPPETASLPADPTELRGMLPNGDIRGLAEQVEGALGVDIVRDPGLSTDYSLRIGNHAIIVLKSTIYWFRANWSIAHELGHLALGHHIDGRMPPAEEAPADAFAAEFLLPEAVVRDVSWQSIGLAEFALWIWQTGVSTAALSRRLRDLRIDTSMTVREALKQPTPELLRAHIGLLRNGHTHGDPIWERENATTGRQFPEHVVAALTQRVEAGEANPYLLAWVREVPVDDLSWPEPDPDEPLAREEDDSQWFELLEAR